MTDPGSESLNRILDPHPCSKHRRELKIEEGKINSTSVHHFFPEGSVNIISLHKSVWKCPMRDFSFILCKYLYIICFVNLRTSLRKIYGHGTLGGKGYLYIRKSFHFNGNKDCCHWLEIYPWIDNCSFYKNETNTRSKKFEN